MLDSLYTLSFAAGTAFSILGAGMHLLGGGTEAPGLDALEGGWVLTKFASPTAIVAGLIGFGLGGHLGLAGLGSEWVALGPALVGGAALAWPSAAFVRRLKQDTGLLLDEGVEGLPAVVTVPIRAHEVGEIQFERRGMRASEAARGAQGQAFPKGAEVAIVAYRDGIAEVASLHLEPPPASPQGQALPPGLADPTEA